jgi:hypothetical protein
MHAEYIIRAANAKEHVICEKPKATTVEDARQMLDACRKNGVQLAIGYRLHFEPFNQRVMELGQQQKYGKVKSICRMQQQLCRQSRSLVGGRWIRLLGMMEKKAKPATVKWICPLYTNRPGRWIVRPKALKTTRNPSYHAK